MDIQKIVHKISLLHSVSTETPTDFQLCCDILDRMPVDWRRSDLSVLDPACGRGTFLLAATRMLLDNGHRPRDIIDNMLWGMDISKVQHMITVRALSMVDDAGTLAATMRDHIINEDALTKEWNMKFDVVIGNAPFQEATEAGRKDQASNLWSKFWSMAFRVTKDDGKIALISPTSWLSPSADLKGKDKIDGEGRLWNVFGKYTSYANVQDVARHFPGVGSSFGYVVVDKSGSDGLIFSDGARTDLGFLPKSNVAQAQTQLAHDRNLDTTFKISQDRGNGICVSIPLTRSLTPDHIETLDIGAKPTKGSDKPELYIYVAVPDLETANLVKNRVIECLDLLNDSCRWSGFLNIQIVKMIKWSR